MNPFIELYQDPVSFLTALAYALLLLTLLIVTLSACWSNAVNVKVRWDRRHVQNFHDEKWQYVPPAGWLIRVAAIPFILMTDAWALAALLWLLGA